MPSTSRALAIGNVTDPGDHLALHRVQAELEIRHHAEVAAAAAHAPEQLRILFGAGVPQLPVRGDHVDGLEVVDGHAELARATRPNPPPSVSPPTPVCDTVPRGVTSPCAMHS